MTDNDCGYYEAKCSSLEEGYLKLQRENYKLMKENEQLKQDKKLLIDFIKKEFPKSHKHILEGFE